MFVCVCASVTKEDVLAAVSEGARSMDDVIEKTGAMTCCLTCEGEIEDVLSEAVSGLASQGLGRNPPPCGFMLPEPSASGSELPVIDLPMLTASIS